jgi:hypothetical protein
MVSLLFSLKIRVDSATPAGTVSTNGAEDHGDVPKYFGPPSRRAKMNVAACARRVTQFLTRCANIR